MKNPEIEKQILTVEYLITREFNSSTDFSIFIEKEAIRRKIGYMESLMEYCEKKDIDPPSIVNLISSSLKEKLRAEAEEANLLKRKGKLPL